MDDYVIENDTAPNDGQLPTGNQPSVTPPKKKHTGLIVALVLIGVLVVLPGIGLAIWGGALFG